MTVILKLKWPPHQVVFVSPVFPLLAFVQERGWEGGLKPDYNACLPDLSFGRTSIKDTSPKHQELKSQETIHCGL